MFDKKVNYFSQVLLAEKSQVSLLKEVKGDDEALRNITFRNICYTYLTQKSR
jgi:hypothetical protein